MRGIGGLNAGYGKMVAKDIPGLSYTVWLNQNQIVELFQSSKANISKHIF
ncbi:hypothetical protein SAMN04488101_101719 [Pedobacter nyackensis]|uniref:Uncharacterized protein n=1 Tax=Pedobacter nyackensis TaxID=475255 RepID=A0A1W2AKZ0_9SPHI|nr:hypothetical protein SAMN04488101_101719 [Pedobacter nyackensis]